MKRAAKGHSLQVLTANSLVTGSVVFLAPDGSWSNDVAAAEIAEEPVRAEALQQAGERDVARHVIVEPYLVDVRREGAGVTPLLLREKIRALGGPTIRENRTIVERPAA